MRYIVAIKHITEPSNSIDGKQHTRMLYFAGIYNNGFECSSWLEKAKATIFTNKKDAEKVAKKYNAIVKEIR